METHTPEIWHNTGLEIRNQAGMIIATVYKHLEANQSKETAISNAELIARAPELLEENERWKEKAQFNENEFFRMRDIKFSLESQVSTLTEDNKALRIVLQEIIDCQVNPLKTLANLNGAIHNAKIYLSDQPKTDKP